MRMAEAMELALPGSPDDQTLKTLRELNARVARMERFLDRMMFQRDATRGAADRRRTDPVRR